jgi:hypothetical protein
MVMVPENLWEGKTGGSGFVVPTQRDETAMDGAPGRLWYPYRTGNRKGEKQILRVPDRDAAEVRYSKEDKT